MDKHNIYLYIDKILSSEKIMHPTENAECVLIPFKFLSELKEELKSNERQIEMAYLAGRYVDKPISGFHDD